MAPRHPTLALSYVERSELANLTPLATYLLRLMQYKSTNLCVAADVTTTAELLRIAEEVGDEICVLKTHADIIDDFGDRTIRGLNDVAQRKKFLVFEDRKFGDIGNTVQQQYSGGRLTIVRWASIVNAHLFPGPSIITALAQTAHKAILAYNTSVQTEIRASPPLRATRSAEEAVEEQEEDNDDDYDGDSMKEEVLKSWQDRVKHAMENSDDEPEFMDVDARRRKQSVVSISTTISMKSETLSPPPSVRQSHSRGSPSDDKIDEGPEDDSATSLEELGPPPFSRSLLLFAQMSSKDNYFTPEYTAACVKHARENKDFVMGFIAQKSLNERPDDNFITMTPGVQLAAGGDSLGQQYNTPQSVIGDAGCDVIIVGRGILAASNRKQAAAEYRKQGWLAYEGRLYSGKKQRR